jgi:hypothetical protein
VFVLPLLAALAASVFASETLRIARRDSSAALYVWSIALDMFAAGAAILAWGVGFGWGPGLFRAYYVLGPILNVAWLGGGTIWLLAPRRFATAATVVLIAASGWAAYVTATAPLLPGARELLASRHIVGGAMVMPGSVRNLSRIFSYAGTAALVGGLGWSIARRRSAVAGLVLLLVGSMTIFAVSIFARRGDVIPFSAGLAVGIVLMFLGFLRASR